VTSLWWWPDGLPWQPQPHSYRRVWQETSLASGSDVSWGLAALICKRWGIGAMELEGTKALVLGGSVEGRYVCVCIVCESASG
jgi:hypothetical protein